MNNRYVVSNVPNKNYDLWKVKLDNGKICIYWKNKNVVRVNEIIIIMNNSKGVSVTDGQVCISLSGVDELNDMISMINIICRELRIDIRNVKVKFVVDNEKELEIADKFKDMGLEADVEKTEEYQKSIQKKEEVLNDKNLVGNKTVETFDGKKYTELSNGGMVANLGILSNNEQLRSLYEDYMTKNPSVRQAFNSGQISRDQIIEELQRQLLNQNNLKTYDMDRASNSSSVSDSANKIKNNYTEYVGGTYNSEIGIVKDENGEYQSIDNDGNVYKAQVDQVTYTDSGVVNSANGGYGYVANANEGAANDNDFDYDDDRVQKRDYIDKLAVYYMDDSGYIYDSDGVVIGKNGDGHLIVDENNNLLLDGQVKGSIDDIRNMGVSKVQSKPKIYVKEKPSNYGSSNKKNSGGFVNLPIIIFVISFLLLIGSGIILFMMK